MTSGLHDHPIVKKMKKSSGKQTERPDVGGLFPARKLNMNYGERVWCKARDLFFKRGINMRSVAQALRINYNTVRTRARKERWHEMREKGGPYPPEWFTPRQEVIKLRRAATGANDWIRRKKLDTRRLEVINEAAEKIMTREAKAKEQLDRIVDKTPALLDSMDDAVKALGSLKDAKGNVPPSAIGLLKDLAAAHGKIVDTLRKLETTPDRGGGGLAAEGGWIGILGAVRLKDEPKVLEAQAVDKARNVMADESLSGAHVRDAATGEVLELDANPMSFSAPEPPVPSVPFRMPQSEPAFVEMPSASSSG